MDKGIKQVVVLLAHPDIKSSQANKALMDAIKELEEVAVYNLYEMRPEDAFNVDSWSNDYFSGFCHCVSVPVVLDVSSFPIEEMAG